ncbi:MAG: rhodanese-like domain-containing protein [Tannerella sp.]|jgi:rhodanese-related sulfurtransferase|nr:rhodanese-like domain-containing protein [Tannerella sp.]
MMKKVIFIICLVVSFCGRAQKQSFVSYKPAEFEKLIGEDADLQLVDVRRPDEYAAGHLENAVLINVLDSGFVAEADSLLDKSKPVAVYCRSGKRSRDAAVKLSGRGFKVYELEGGYNGWVDYQKSKK